MAVTGHMGFAPNVGSFRNFTVFLDWIVFDHLMTIWIPGFATIMSPLARWYRAEK